MFSEVEFTNKNQAITSLKEIFNLWNDQLSSMTDQQVSSISVHKNRTIKDDLAHLYMWQRISVARLEAAIHNSQPNLDFWPKEFNPDTTDTTDTNKINEWIFSLYRRKSWSEVYNAWKDNFSKFISLSQQIDEKILLKPGYFSWLRKYPLIAVLSGTYNHHREHFEKLKNIEF